MLYTFFLALHRVEGVLHQLRHISYQHHICQSYYLMSFVCENNFPVIPGHTWSYLDLVEKCHFSGMASLSVHHQQPRCWTTMTRRYLSTRWRNCILTKEKTSQCDQIVILAPPPLMNPVFRKDFSNKIGPKIIILILERSWKDIPGIALLPK